MEVAGSDRGLIGMAYPTHHPVYDSMHCNPKRFRIQDIWNPNHDQTVQLEVGRLALENILKNSRKKLRESLKNETFSGTCIEFKALDKPMVVFLVDNYFRRS